jgi:50S ribosomal protein L16 3-hydroxylase
VLAEWLDASTYEAFLTHRRARRAFAWPRVGAISGQLFDWDRLHHILAHPVAPDALITRDGALIDAALPRDAAAARALLDGGCGLVVRRAQRRDEALAELGERLGRELAGTVQIQLFVTPARTRGFAWHYDGEDVLILQTIGSKTYYMRDNTVVADPSRTVDFARLRDEVSPLQACTLHAGDLLYLPRGMWHMGRADSTALSISLGVTPSDSQAR